MAQKRMFNNLVIGNDDFLEMPDSAQNLYFHLSMQADDDGFVDNWKSIMRMTGKKEDDLKILIAKSFVIPFDTGVIVIKHWRLNNYIQKDRYKETIHIFEKAQLLTDENNVYNLDTNCIHSIDKIRLDKNSIDKNSIYNIYGQNLDEKEIPEAEILENWEVQFNEFYNKYPKKVKKQDVMKWFKKNKPSNELFSTMMNSLEDFIISKEWQRDSGQYIPYPTSWLNQRRWEDDGVEQTTKMSALQRAYQKGGEYD